MPHYGLKLFDEDLAADMRSSWDVLLAAGATTEEATARTETEFAASLRDVDEEPIFRLALAALQERSAALQPAVRDAAIEVIDSGRDLARWETEQDRRQRQEVLEQLRASLVHPRSKAVRVRKPFVSSTNLEAGDIFSYRRTNGHLALFRVYRIEMPKSGDRSPFVELLDYDGEMVPNHLALDQLHGMPSPWPRQSGWERDRTIGYVLLDERGRPEPKDRIEILVKGLEPRGFHPYRGPYSSYLHWKDLDASLERIFGKAEVTW